MRDVFEAVMVLNNKGLLSDEESMWKLKQAYMQEKPEDNKVPEYLQEIPKAVPQVSVGLQSKGSAKIDALRKALK